MGLMDILHEGRTRHLVVADADELWLAFGCGGEQFPDSGVADDGAHIPIEGAGCAAALDMAQDRHTGVFLQPLGEHLFHIFGRDGIPVAVDGAFGHQHHVVTPTALAPGEHGVTHGSSSHPSWGGFSGIKIQLAPVARPAMSAR